MGFLPPSSAWSSRISLFLSSQNLCSSSADSSSSCSSTLDPVSSDSCSFSTAVNENNRGSFQVWCVGTGDTGNSAGAQDDNRLAAGFIKHLDVIFTHRGNSAKLIK